MDHDARRRLLRALPAPLHALVVRHDAHATSHADAMATAKAAAHATLVSWGTQLSFEPPMLAVALERDGTTLPLVERARTFTLAPLDARDGGAVALARRIGRPGIEAPDKDAGLALAATPSGAPVLVRGTLGWLECRVVAVHAAGDHVLVVAAIVDAAVTAVGAADDAAHAAPDLAPLTAAAAGWSYAG